MQNAISSSAVHPQANPMNGYKDIYYVMDKASPDCGKVASYGRNVVPYMSLKHMIYNLAADIYVGSDSKRHLYTWRPKPNRISYAMRKKKIFFLKGYYHGNDKIRKSCNRIFHHGTEFIKQSPNFWTFRRWSCNKTYQTGRTFKYVPFRNWFRRHQYCGRCCWWKL